MFRSYAIALMVALSCAPAFAAPAATQPAPQVAPSTPSAAPQHQIMAVDAAQNRLHLTTDQQVKLNSILDKARAQAGGIQSDTKMSDADKKSKMTALSATVHQQVMSVMTPPQRIAINRARAEQAKYQAVILQLAQQHQALQQKLGASITPAQKAKLTVIQKEIQAYFTTLQSDKTLSDDQRKAKLKSKLEDANKRMTSILTPAQHTLFDKLNATALSLTKEEKLFQAAAI